MYWELQWVNEWMIACMDEWMGEWMFEWMDEWMFEWLDKWLDWAKWTELMNEWMKVWMNEWSDESTIHINSVNHMEHQSNTWVEKFAKFNFILIKFNFLIIRKNSLTFILKILSGKNLNLKKIIKSKLIGDDFKMKWSNYVHYGVI